MMMPPHINATAGQALLGRLLTVLMAAVFVVFLLLPNKHAQARQIAHPPQPATSSNSAQTAPRIALLTMQPGTVFFERFGHDALLVEYPHNGQRISYNFGFFDMQEPGFFWRFLHGDMQYMLVALPLDEDLAYYRDVGRGVSLQWLNLTPTQAQRLADALAQNARPENARYQYQYFTNNCATQVRDALDTALDGALQPLLQAQATNLTYRSESVRLASPDTLMALAFDIALGPAADLPLNQWQASFVPMFLANTMQHLHHADAPLVLQSHTLLPHHLPPEPSAQPARLLHWLSIGLLLALGMAALALPMPRLALGLSALLWCMLGIIGALLLYIWGFTQHHFIWANQNMLLFNPLYLLLLPAALAVLRRRASSARTQSLTRWLLVAIACCLLLAIVQSFVGFLPYQNNRHWLVFLLPLQLASVFVLWRATRNIANNTD